MRLTATLAALILILSLTTLQADRQSQTVASPSDSPKSSETEEILKLLREIRQMLGNRFEIDSGKGAYRSLVVKLTKDEAVLGERNAPLTMIDYTDLQCPFCRQFAMTAFPDIKKNWIDTGKLRYVARDLPLEFHSHAMAAARAGRCSGEQGRFWEMRQTLVSNAHRLSPEFIDSAATQLGLDRSLFVACISSKKHDDAITSGILEAQRIGITATPSFIIGRTAEDGVRGQVIAGAAPYAVFDTKLREMLEGSAK